MDFSDVVLTKHDPGCRYAREENGGHTDAAKRIADWYGIHRAAQGFRASGVFACRLDDGTSDGQLYPNRNVARHYMGHNAHLYLYVHLGPSHMTICEAASYLRFSRHAYKLNKTHVDESTGLEIIPRLTISGRDQQIAAMDGRLKLPIAMGKRKGRIE